MRSSLRFLFALFFSLLLGGCFASDAARNAGAPSPEDSPEVKRKLAEIYADKPEYMVLVSRLGTPSRLSRTRTVGAPAPHGAEVFATVTVVFVEDEQGRLRDPRVFESSDSKFDEAVLDGVRKMESSSGGKMSSLAKFVFITIPLYKVAEPEKLKNSGRSKESTAAALGVSS